MNWIYFFKSLHVIGFVSWFAGLFYLVRIFVYHIEAKSKPAEEARILTNHFQQMERRVYKIICNPAMMITWTGGLAMLIIDLTGVQTRGYLSSGSPGWMHLKLLLVVLLTAYHLYCKGIIKKLETDQLKLGAWQLRLLNEVPTLFLAAITFIAVYGKDGRLNYGYLAIGLLVFAFLVYRGALAYRKRREKI